MLRAIDKTKSTFKTSADSISTINTNVEVLTEKVNEYQINAEVLSGKVIEN